MATRSKSTAKGTTRKLSVKKETVRDLAPATKGKGVKGGRLPETKACAYLPPK